MASGSAVSGIGTLAFIEFVVLDSTKTSSVLSLEDTRLNSGAMVFRKMNGSVSLSDTFGISRSVRYYQGNKVVSGVNLGLLGERNSYTASTDQSGNYSVIGITSGDYKMKASFFGLRQNPRNTRCYHEVHNS
jgi:hypothetical protein